MKKDKKKSKTQSSDSCSQTCTNMDCLRLHQLVPSSPPPSYEVSLQKTGQSSEQGGRHSATDDEKYATGSDHHQACGSGSDCRSIGSPVRQEIFHKSSKEFYKAVAAQWGITCKMSDHCRCLECQSRYFDCEYDQENEQEKTDGGLGAGTPMFLSEVMNGSTCTLI